jgi:hypothetical protein
MYIYNNFVYPQENQNKNNKVSIWFGLKEFLRSIFSGYTPRIRGRREEECRRIIENITGKPFIKVRPKFLKYPPTGKNLELDGYNEELKMAFEYNGEQHYKFCPFFHKSYEDLYKQRDHDFFKKQKCAEYGIKLITIPYTVKNLYPYIYSEIYT